ncbi:UbiA prenyltransferase family-domain-containing protein [Gautieria morchelliformis]|nr:UbiA prenyltransferase family-domain-containing protein [Gautieria morchelliformis]
MNIRRRKNILVYACQVDLGVPDGSPDIVTTRRERSSYGDSLSLYRTTPPLSFSHLLKAYGQLSKSRLTFLVVLTSMSGVALSPLPATVPVLLSTAIGTALCSASANTLNQLKEVPFDAQMARTRMRPLVRGAISSAHATGFAITAGLVGPAILATFCNPVAAVLGMANIGLYAGVYTSLKRSSVMNTWVGSVVGGIPPLIGWTACGGKLLPLSAYPIELFPPPILFDIANAIPVEHVDNPLSALGLFCLAFSWQFPHFNPLAHTVRESYAQGGYKMLAVTNPPLNALVSLRHSVALIGICSVLIPLSGLTTWAFAMTSLIPNTFLSRAAWKFWRIGTEKEAKALFHTSLWYLPVVLALMMFHKQGMEWLEFIGWRDRKSPKDMPVLQ